MSSCFTADFLARFVLLGVTGAFLVVASGDSSILTAFLFRVLLVSGVVGGLDSCTGSGTASALAELLVARAMLGTVDMPSRFDSIVKRLGRSASSRLWASLNAMVGG